MSYDFDDCNREPPIVTDFVADPKDLETIVATLELAAIYLTPHAGATFSFEQLFNQVQEIGGGEIVFEEADVRIVIKNCSFLKKVPGGLFKI